MAKPQKKSAGGVSKIIAAICECRRVLAIDPRGVPARTAGAHEVMRRQAQDDLAPLHDALAAETIPDRLVALFAEGDSETVAAAAKIVAQGGIVAAADALWRRAAEAAEPSFGPGRAWGPSQWHLMMQSIAEAARDVGYTEMTQLPLENDVPTTDVADLARYVAGLVARSPDLVDLQYRHLRGEILAQVVTGDLCGSVVPVLVTGAAPSEIASLRRLFARAILHPFVSETPTRESLTDIFKVAT